MDFKWMNQGTIKTEGDRIEIQAPAKSDFFCSMEAPGAENAQAASVCNAPFYYTEITGDFVMRAKVSHDFKDTYDASSIMVLHDTHNWAKACFEMTDYGTHAAVSVVTKDGASDDANGCNINGNTAWLQICRCGNTFAIHYSADGKNFYMMRFFYLKAGKALKAGLLAQAPVGNGGSRIFENFTIGHKTVKNIRTGI